MTVPQHLRTDRRSERIRGKIKHPVFIKRLCHDLYSERKKRLIHELVGMINQFVNQPEINAPVQTNGTGSNALNIIRFFRNSDAVKVDFVLSNKQDAKIVSSAKEEGVNVVVVSNQEVEASDKIIELCIANKIDYIILAGFLRKIPEKLIRHYPDRIINIHPSLLPKYGGKGMFGANVHKAVLENNEKESGITIHFVNSEFDK
ncbi:formyl transferase, partial [Ancylostoma ceylanicum]